MKTISTPRRLAITILHTLTTAAFPLAVVAQLQLPGKRVVAPVKKQKTSTKRHSPTRKNEQREDSSENTDATKPPDTVPSPGVEEKKQGIEAYNNNNFDLAIEKLNLAKPYLYSDAEIFYYLGDSYSEKKLSDKAVESYEHALSLNASMASDSSYFNQGAAYEDLDRYNEALSAYKKALESYKKTNNVKSSVETL